MLKISLNIFILLLLTLLGCTDTRMETKTSCDKKNSSNGNTCSILVYHVKNGTLPILLSAPKVKNVYVEVTAKIEEGMVELWIKDTSQQKTSIMIKAENKNATLKGLAAVKESFVDEKPIFKIFIKPHGSFSNKQAENILIQVSYRKR